MNKVPTKRIARRSLYSAIAIASLMACGHDTAGVGVNANVSEAMFNFTAGHTVLRIAKDSPGSRGYFVGASTIAVAEAAMTNELQAARLANPTETTLYLYAYPGVSGFQLAGAFYAAQVAGFTNMVAVKNYTDDASPKAREQWKTISHSLDPLPAQPPHSDSIRPAGASGGK